MIAPRPGFGRRALLALVGSVSLAACGKGHKSITGPVDVTGTYALESIDAHALPAPIGANSQAVTQARSGSLTINADSTFAIGFVVTATGHDSTIAANGTYARLGNDLYFTSTVDGLTGTLPGSVAGSKGINLTVYFAGGTHQTVFRRP